MPSTFLYQGIGKGTISLFWTIVREIVFAVPLTYLFGIVFNWGLIGIWLGLAVGRTTASFLNYAFARFTIKKIRYEFGS